MKKTDFELIDKYMNEPAVDGEHASWQILLLAYRLLQDEYARLSMEDIQCIASVKDDFRLMSGMNPDMNKVSALKGLYDRIMSMPGKVQYHVSDIREQIWEQISDAYEEMRKKIVDMPHPYQNLIDLMGSQTNTIMGKSRIRI